MPDLKLGNTFLGYLNDNQAAFIIELAKTCDELDILRTNAISHPLNEDNEYLTDVAIHINFMKKGGT